MRRAARQYVGGAPIPWGIVERNLKVVNRNIVLARYSFERIAKSFKRGELQRRRGEKETNRETRSQTHVPAKRVRGVYELFGLVGALAYLVAAKVTLNPHTQKPAYAAPKISQGACRPRSAAVLSSNQTAPPARSHVLRRS